MNRATNLRLWMVIALLMIVQSIAACQGPYTMTANNENNGGLFWVGPNTSMSVTVVVKDAAGEAVTGIPVSFSVQNAHTQWTLTPPSHTATTDDCGQASAALYAASDDTANLHCKWTTVIWVGPPLFWYEQVHAEAYMDLVCETRHAPSDSGADPAIGWGRIVPSFGILWVSNSRFTDEIGTGAGSWASTQRASFAQGSLEDAYTVLCQDSCDSTTERYALVQKVFGTYIMTFNTSALDPCPRGTCNALFPPRSVRHHIVQVAAHEFGHVLGLTHTEFGTLTAGDEAALMWSDTRPWFLYRTASPMIDELNGLIALGY